MEDVSALRNRRLESRIASIQEKQARAQEKLAQVRGKGTAHNGYIVFEVDGGGKFLDLRLDPRAEELRLKDLESEIKAAARAAVADAARQANEAMAELMSDPRIAKAMDELKGFSQGLAPRDRAQQASGAQPGSEDYDPPRSWLERR